MKLPAEPDEVIRCIPNRCSGCQGLAGCISGQAFEVAESRYVVDAVMEVRVREYRAMRVKSCPVDGRRGVSIGSCGQFPEGVRAHVQYGDSFAAVAGILNTYGAVSTSRVSDLIRSMFGVSLSVGTVDSMLRRCAECAEESLEGVSEKSSNATSPTRRDRSEMRWQADVGPQFLDAAVHLPDCQREARDRRHIRQRGPQGFPGDSGP